MILIKIFKDNIIITGISDSSDNYKNFVYKSYKSYNIKEYINTHTYDLYIDNKLYMTFPIYNTVIDYSMQDVLYR